MPKQKSDQDSFNVDEMMGHLKNEQHADVQPELVTRSDGSQALKVRKRKRRTDQTANKESRKKKRIQIFQIVGAVLLFTTVSLVVGIGILYVNSAAYRDSLTAKMEESSGAKVKLEQFRMNPVDAKARGTSLTWPEGNVLDKLELYGVKAKISPSSFLGKTFGGAEILADSGKLFLKASDPSKPTRHIGSPEGGLPVKFSRYAVPSLDIRFGGFGGLTKTEASFFPSSVAGQAEMRLTGGDLKLSDWPAMTLERSYIQFRYSELIIQNMRFQLPEADRHSSGAYIDFSGSLSPIGLMDTHTLSAKLVDFPLPYLVGGDLGRFFVGRVDNIEVTDSNFLSFDIDSPEDTKLEFTVRNSMDSRIDMSGFKFLQMLALAFNDRWYESPVFDDEVGIIVKRTGNKTNLSGLNLVKRGRMVVRGDLSNGEGGAIKGKLRIGIPETTLVASKDKKLLKMFAQVREGYRWLDLEISGTGAVPDDNFRTIYKDTASEESSTSDNEEPKDSFDNLIKGE